jgi:hypothetical protein
MVCLTVALILDNLKLAPLSPATLPGAKTGKWPRFHGDCNWLPPVGSGGRLRRGGGGDPRATAHDSHGGGRDQCHFLTAKDSGPK